MSTQKKSQPNFSTLLWDNTKTTGFYGGKATGTITGAVVSGSLTLALSPILIFCCTVEGLEETARTSFKGGFVLGATTGVANGVFFLALPFAISAQLTRKFKANTKINTSLETLRAVKHVEHAQTIIREIISEDNSRNDDIGVRSAESKFLIDTLKDNTSSTQEKWDALHKYMHTRSEHAYTHNGKKLFNTVLNVLNKHQNKVQNIPTASQEEIKTVFRILKNNSDAWSKQGIAFFRKFTPKGILQLSQSFEHTNINTESDIDLLSAEVLKNLSLELKSIAHSRGTDSLRSDTTNQLYHAIKNLGTSDNEAKLQKLEASFNHISENEASALLNK